jgi:hypothetical protein
VVANGDHLAKLKFSKALPLWFVYPKENNGTPGGGKGKAGQRDSIHHLSFENMGYSCVSPNPRASKYLKPTPESQAKYKPPQPTITKYVQLNKKQSRLDFANTILCDFWERTALQ